MTLPATSGMVGGMLGDLRVWLQSLGLTEVQAGWAARAASIVAVVVAAFVADWVAKRILVRMLGRLARMTATDWDDALVRRRVFDRLAHMVPAFLIHQLAPAALADYPGAISAVQSIALAAMVLFAVLVLDAFLSAVADVYNDLAVAREVPIKGPIQIVKLILYCAALVGVVSILAGRSPLALLGGFGAMTAVVMLIFRDAILGFVAGIQLAANRMVARGDWIEMPKYGADGEVLEVALTTVKVQNWDKSITSLPTYALISESFKNWRGMDESGGRRIKRAISIDMSSVRFCDEAMFSRFEKIQLLSDYLAKKRSDVQTHNEERRVDPASMVNGRRLTNLGTFRAYVEAYLRDHPLVHQGMTFLVRQLPPGPSGIPIEIYVFSQERRWAIYESIQADIFDHILAVVPEFELRVFQAPTGSDVRSLAPPAA